MICTICDPRYSEVADASSPLLRSTVHVYACHGAACVLGHVLKLWRSTILPSTRHTSRPSSLYQPSCWTDTQGPLVGYQYEHTKPSLHFLPEGIRDYIWLTRARSGLGLDNTRSIHGNPITGDHSKMGPNIVRKKWEIYRFLCVPWVLFTTVSHNRAYQLKPFCWTGM